MELYLQLGHGMMQLSRDLISDWNGGTVVLSPRDLEPQQMNHFASEILGLPGGTVLLDPQFYVPRADHFRLTKHSYWPKAYDTAHFWQADSIRALLTELAAINVTLGCRGFILPGLLASRIDDDWIATQRALLHGAASLSLSLPLISTIALSAEALQDQNQIETLLDWAEQDRCAAYYLVCGHPNDSYLVDAPIWLAGLLDLTSGLRLRGAEVIIGYCNHQMLVAAVSKVTAVCSGNWMNVRCFTPGRFSNPDGEVKKKTVWYYCPQALSEYKVQFLDLAFRAGILSRMAPDPVFGSRWIAGLFGGGQPSSVGFGETAGFHHYLHSLHAQVARTIKASFDETVEDQRAMLTNAETLLEELTTAGIRGEARGFSEMIDVNRGAIDQHVRTSGPMLRHRWASI